MIVTRPYGRSWHPGGLSSSCHATQGGPEPVAFRLDLRELGLIQSADVGDVAPADVVAGSAGNVDPEAAALAGTPTWQLDKMVAGNGGHALWLRAGADSLPTL
jgi:hypothetical protein